LKYWCNHIGAFNGYRFPGLCTSLRSKSKTFVPFTFIFFVYFLLFITLHAQITTLLSCVLFLADPLAVVEKGSEEANAPQASIFSRLETNKMGYCS